MTDGRYTYLRPCRDDLPVEYYSTMLMNTHGWFQPIQIPQEFEAGRFLPYTDSPVWRYPAMSYTRHPEPLLFDVQADPKQENNLTGQKLPEETQMRQLLIKALNELKAPESQYNRLELV